MSPPTDSTSSAMSWAERRAVPLNRRCSRKWLAPATASATATTTAAGALPGLVVGTEIAELAAGGVLPRVLERHGLATLAVPARRTDRHRLALRRRLAPTLAAAALATVVVTHERQRELAGVVDVVDAH